MWLPSLVDGWANTFGLAPVATQLTYDRGRLWSKITIRHSTGAMQ
jgi:hypothetical protein